MNRKKKLLAKLKEKPKTAGEKWIWNQEAIEQLSEQILELDNKIEALQKQIARMKKVK